MNSLSSGTATLTPSTYLYLKDLGMDEASPIKVPTVSLEIDLSPYYYGVSVPEHLDSTVLN